MNCPIFVGVLFVACIALPSSCFGQAEIVQKAQPTPAAADTPGKLPLPSGRFGIGRIGYDWTDSSRRDRYSAEPSVYRELMVYIWYPTSQNPEKIKGAYMPGADQMDKAPQLQGQIRDEFGPNWPFIVSRAIFSHAAEGAPLAKGPEAFPVVLFSHGLGGTGFEYTFLIENLVSHGYVVASIEHTESAIVVVFPNGRMIPFHVDSAPAGLSPEVRFQRMAQSVSVGINEGAADVRFVLNRLTELNSTDSQHFPLAGRLDLQRVAAIGHSAGAEFAARACELDARFKACVDLDGAMVPVAALPEYPDGETMKQPLLFLEAYYPESRMGGTHAQHEDYFKKREAQLQATRPGSYSVVINSNGMGHGSFSDYPLLAAGDDPAQIKIALHNLDLTQEYIRAFLDKTLRQEKAPLLDAGNTSTPEVTVRIYGQ
jgi:predicted esterase